ncbi:MAG: aminotransferase class IV, partial [Rhodospirillales bacterium]|nr:aminotransferase class IV [Rhodospirillales bacterium]
MVVERANERVCYFNGEIVPESRALVSFRDRSFRYGDGAFDTTRTFGHRLFKLEEHIVRFYKTLRYLRIDPGMAPSEMKRHTEEVLARNLHLLGPDEDYWVFQRISRGLEPAGGDFHGSTDPVLIIDCTPLPIPQRAHYFRDGIPLMVPSNRRAAPDSLSPRAKTHNYLSLFVGNDEVRRIDPNALALFLDHNGNLSEGVGSNIFLVTDD